MIALLIAATLPMAVIDEANTVRLEAPPHGAIGMSTAWHITNDVPQRSMEFRKRALHKGAAIGIHPIGHDEVYYVLSGTGEVEADGEKAQLKAGMAAYLRHGQKVGIRNTGDDPLVLIISYPLPR